MKKMTALFCTLLLLSSCSAGGTASADTNVSDDTSSAAESTGPSDGLGEFDFGGETFRVLTRSTPLFYPNLNVDEQSGDTLSDAVYNRNRKIEDRFHFTITEDFYDYIVEGSDYPRKYLESGDDSYDMFIGRCVYLYKYAAEGLIRPIDQLTYINPDQPWWNAQLGSDLEILGTKYFVVGGFNISAYDMTHVLLFNKQMIEDYQLDNPYTLVRDGKWTFDRYGELARTAVNDINGDSQMDENDQYGYTALCKQVMPSFWISAGTTTIRKDDEGKLVYTAPTDERFIEVYQRIFEISWDDNIWHQNPINYETENQELDIFTAGRALFANSSCFQISSLRSSEVDFGILPYPKYDDNQDKYYSRIEACELFGVPYTNTNTEMTSVIMEALAFESMQSVVPAYYDVALKVKMTRDEESAEMLDIIFENRVFDFGDTVLGDIIRDGVVREKFAANQRDAVSALTSVSQSVTAELNKINEGFLAIAAAE